MCQTTPSSNSNTSIGMSSSSHRLPLSDKVAIVTGAGTGIGRGIAQVLGEAGVKHVVIVGRRREKLLETQALIGPDQCSIHVGDVSSQETCHALVQSTLAQHGAIDILINNAGLEGPAPGPLEQTTVEDYDQVMNVNLKSQFLLCQAVIPHMKERSAKILSQYESFEQRTAARPHAGTIINLSSIAGVHGFGALSAYSASNFGRQGLTRSLALELAPHHITCNAIAPGIVWTELWDRLAQGMTTDEDGEKMATFENTCKSLIPMKTAQLARDMGEAALYFCTAPNTTGQVLAVDGGYLA